MTPRLTVYLIVALVLSLALLLVVALRADTKQAFAVCEGRCLKSVALGPRARLEVPLRNGKPDWNQAKLYRTTVVVDHALERIEFH